MPPALATASGAIGTIHMLALGPRRQYYATIGNSPDQELSKGWSNEDTTRTDFTTEDSQDNFTGDNDLGLDREEIDTQVQESESIMNNVDQNLQIGLKSDPRLHRRNWTNVDEQKACHAKWMGCLSEQTKHANDYRDSRWWQHFYERELKWRILRGK